MKRIGILGGMSWESSIEYERLINEAVRERLGGASSADLVVRSYNFAQIEAMQEAGEWDELGALLASDAVRLEDAGAELIVLATNTMHVVAHHIVEAVSVPLVHIGDATATAVTNSSVRSVGLLGTRYTMEMSFYRDRLAARGIAVVVPDDADRTIVHDIIFDELVKGIVTTESRAAYVGVVDRLVDRGAAGVVAGCTEIELLLQPGDIDVPLFPTTSIHAAAVVEIALAGETA